MERLLELITKKSIDEDLTTILTNMYSISSIDFIEVGKWFLFLNIPAIVFLFIVKNPVVFLKLFLRCRIFQLGFFKRQIAVGEQLFSYIERGNSSSKKTSLLFIHGYSNSKEIFLDVIAWLPRDLHVISVDLPGHGESMWDEKDQVSITNYVDKIHQFVQAVGLNKKKFHIVGESMGGHIAGVYSATHPSSIEKTTLMCPHGIKFDQMEKMKAEYERTGHCILLPDSLQTVREMFECVLHKKFPFPDFVLNGILQMRLQNDDFNKKLLLRLVSSEDEDLLERSLHNIRSPCTLLWGKQDKILDVSCADKIKSNLPNLKKTVIFDDAGHVLSIDCPRKVANNLMEC
uniref:acylglycerol lipase n=1 Tax=Clytia hemisphaerica TaxID=252671 RepID=A0A069DNH7_9CNID